MSKVQKTKKTNINKEKLLRCVDWLQNQESQEPKKLSQLNKNDIQFIIQTNADRKNFLISSADDVATVPAGVGELVVEPKRVPISRLRKDKLHLECEWQNCKWYVADYEKYQNHVREHIKQINLTEVDGASLYLCLWDVCGFKTSDWDEFVRHMNYHAYHARLMAIGFNARATMSLAACRKDSSKRNHLPPLKTQHTCFWTGCDEKYNSIQMLYDHVKRHIMYMDTDECLCSWAGCGLKFSRKGLLIMHVRSHTAERLIACFHCGRHFATNTKLNEHLLRQNVDPKSEHSCTICGCACATAYLARCHERQHVSQHACTLCDMTAPSLALIAQHMRYRHMPPEHIRPFACPHCEYRAVTKSDLRKHVDRHERRKKKEQNNDESDEENELLIKKEKKPKKKFICHVCPKNRPKIFARGTKLTKHLVKVHGAQWPFGYSRFRYQICDDGMYRLTTTRYEILEVSEKIGDGSSGPKDSFSNTFDYNLQEKAEPTMSTPRRFEISVKRENEDANEDIVNNKDAVEITMCDVDEEGNIISSEIILSDVKTIKEE